MPQPEFPVVEGRYSLTGNWAITLPQPFRRRIEDDSLVLWRPGVTAWIIVWGHDEGESQRDRLEWLQGGTSPDAFEIESSEDGDITRYSYRLTEQRGEQVVHALYAFAIGVSGHVQMAIYSDDESDLAIARSMCASLEESSAA